MFSSNAAKQLASTALQAGKTAAKDIGKKAIDVGKTVAIDASKKLVEKAVKKLSKPKSQVANVIVPPEEITKKVNEVIAKYVDTYAINLNKLIDGSSVNRPNASTAIAIQNLVRWINGSGLKVSIEEYEYHQYEHITGTSLNNGGDIRISIESQDIFTHPRESYLILEGRLTKADGTLYVNADEVAMTNNAIMHLFSRIEYHLSNQLIETLNYPGQATTMLGLLKYPDDFSKAQDLN